MIVSPVEEKARLRAALRARLTELPASTLEAAGRELREAILVEPAFWTAETVFCYVSTAREPDTLPLLRAVMESGRRLVVPRCREGGEMDAAEIRSLTELRPGRYGIPEPSEEAPVVSPEQISLALIPALALGPDGTRLGKGGGYYDRYLPGLRCPIWGLAWFFCALPTAGHDIPVSRCFVPRDTAWRKDAL